MPIALPSAGTPAVTFNWFRARITTSAGFTFDVTKYLKSVERTMGRTSATEASISAASLTCVFDDTAGTFDTDNTASPLFGKLTTGPLSTTTFRLDTYVASLNAYKDIYTGYFDSLERTHTAGDYSESTATFLDSTAELTRHIPPSGLQLPAEFPGARIARLLTQTSRSGFMWQSRALTAPTALDRGQKMLGPMACDGSTSSWDIAVQAAAAEDGLLFFDPSGVLTFHGQQRRLVNNPAWTFSDDLNQVHYEAGLTFRISTDDLIVDAAVTTTDGVTSVYGPGGASRGAPTVTADISETSQLQGHVSGAGRAKHLFDTRSVARRNAPTLTVNAIPTFEKWTVSGLPTTYQAAVMGAVDDLALVVRHPYMGSVISQYHWIEGSSLTASIADGVWQVTFNLSRSDPLPVGGYWVLGVSQLGVNTTLTW